MTIKLAIAGRPTIALSDETITLGSDPTCVVSLPESSGAMPKHAVIRKIAGRWLIEVREAESVIVGDDEPKRLHWLNPGDVIRLTENAPAIIFDPIDDEPLPLPAETPLSAEKPLSLETPISAERPHFSDVILPPDSDPSIPVKKPVSSESPRVPKPPSSGTIRTPKPPSSGTIKSTKPPSSSTIRAVTPTGGTKSSRSSSEIPTAGARLKRKSGQVRLPPTDDEDIASDVPTLQRLSSWDEEDPTERKGLTAEQAEMRWIMMVVGRSVGAGLAVLIVWIAISWAWKAMQPTDLGAGPPLQDNAQNAPVPNTSSPPSSQSSTSTIDSQNAPKKQDDSSGSNPPVKKSRTEKSSVAGMDDENDERSSKESDRPAASKKTDRKSDNRKPASEESASELESASSSPAMSAVMDSIYAVIAEDSDKTKRIQLGTAWSASNRYLVTSATVVSAIEELPDKGLVASVVQISTGKSLRIKSTRLHESYRKAMESAEEAREQKDAKRLAAERATQVRYDLGVLDVGRIERLSKKIAACTDPLDDSTETNFVMVGLPFQQKDASNTAKIDEHSLKERPCKKSKEGVAPQNKEMELTINFGPDANGRNWSGSPVLNKDHKVIGVFSHLPSTGAIGKKPVIVEYGVAWIGRLQEFASDVK